MEWIGATCAFLLWMIWSRVGDVRSHLRNIESLLEASNEKLQKLGDQIEYDIAGVTSEIADIRYVSDEYSSHFLKPLDKLNG